MDGLGQGTQVCFGIGSSILPYPLKIGNAYLKVVAVNIGDNPFGWITTKITCKRWETK